MLEIIRPVLIVAGLGAQEWLPHWISGGEPSPGLRLIYVAIIALVVIGLGVALERPWPSHRVRRALFPQARFEGVWLQRVGQVDRPYSVGLVSFDRNARRWTYRGVGLDPQFRPAAEWETRSLSFDAAHGTCYFDGAAFLLERSSVGVARSANSFRVQPTLNLHEGDENRIDGFVIDVTGSSGPALRTPDAFSIRLQRDRTLMRNPPPTLAKIKDLTADALRSAFERAGMIARGQP